MNARQPHVAQVTRHRLVIDRHPLTPQLRRDASHPVERVSGVDFVNAPFECQLLGGQHHRPVVEAGAVQAEQLHLRRQRPLRLWPALNEHHARLAAQLLGQIFF